MKKVLKRRVSGYRYVWDEFLDAYHYVGIWSFNYNFNGDNDMYHDPDILVTAWVIEDRQDEEFVRQYECIICSEDHEYIYVKSISKWEQDTHTLYHELRSKGLSIIDAMGFINL